MRNWRLLLISFLAIALSGIIFSSLVLAAAPDKVRERVYGLDLWDGKTFQGTFCPKDIPEIYMISNSNNLVMPLITDVYYWPITQEYMGSWFDYRKELKGVLEIWQKDKKIASLPLTKYTYVYPEGAYSENMQLVLGKEAEDKYKEYKSKLDKYYNDLFKYYDQQSKYEEAVAQFYKNPKKFKAPPVAPEQPIPPKEYVSEVSEAFVVNLPPGVYNMQFVEQKEPAADKGQNGTDLKAQDQKAANAQKEEGKKEPEVEPQGTLSKKLIVFDSRRKGIGYEIIPEEKWTMPSSTDEPREALYMEGKRALFLKAFDESEYNAKYYTRLSKLHQPFAGRGLENVYMWVHLKDRTDVKLQLLEGGRVVSTISREPYLVEQTPGYTLGYHIVKFTEKEREAGKQPSFEAFKLELEAKQGMQIRLVDGDGNVIPGSQRIIKTVQPANAKAIYSVAALPLILGALVTLTRRRRAGGGAKGTSKDRSTAV